MPADLAAARSHCCASSGPRKARARSSLELRHHDWLEGRTARKPSRSSGSRGSPGEHRRPAADKKQSPSCPPWTRSPIDRLTYLRLHGRDPKAYLTGETVAERFHYDYTDGELDEVLARARASGLPLRTTVHVVFNNNARDFAPKAAERLRRRLGRVHGCSRRCPHCPQALRPAEAGNAVLARRRLRKKQHHRLAWVRSRLFRVPRRFGPSFCGPSRPDRTRLVSPRAARMPPARVAESIRRSFGGRAATPWADRFPPSPTPRL